MANDPSYGEPRRTVRISNELWDTAKAIAEGRKETVSAVIVRSLENYVRKHRREVPWQEKEKT